MEVKRLVCIYIALLWSQVYFPNDYMTRQTTINCFLRPCYYQKTVTAKLYIRGNVLQWIHLQNFIKNAIFVVYLHHSFTAVILTISCLFASFLIVCKYLKNQPKCTQKWCCKTWKPRARLFLSKLYTRDQSDHSDEFYESN